MERSQNRGRTACRTLQVIVGGPARWVGVHSPPHRRGKPRGPVEGTTQDADEASAPAESGSSSRAFSSRSAARTSCGGSPQRLAVRRSRTRAATTTRLSAGGGRRAGAFRPAAHGRAAGTSADDLAQGLGPQRLGDEVDAPTSSPDRIGDAAVRRDDHDRDVVPAGGSAPGSTCRRLRHPGPAGRGRPATLEADPAPTRRRRPRTPDSRRSPGPSGRRAGRWARRRRSG